jgi:hypothetical protein
MKLAIAFLTLLIALIVIGCLFTADSSVAILFGWVGFLQRVFPKMTVFWPSVYVGLAAFFLFTLGIHWMGRSIFSASQAAAGSKRVWRFKWTASIVAMIVVSFAAGISVIGVMHQVGWLATSNQSLYGEALPAFWDNKANNMRQVVLAVQNCESSMDRFPPAASLDSKGQPLHGWETHILPCIPYVRQGIDMKAPWNDPANAKYFKCIIPEFINPGFRTPELQDSEGYGLNHFAANSQLLKPGSSPKLSEIKDGASNTILLGEVNQAFSPWAKPNNVRDPANGITNDSQGFGGPDGRGATFSMADGAVRYISKDVDPAVLKALSTPAGVDEPSASR